MTKFERSYFDMAECRQRCRAIIEARHKLAQCGPPTDALVDELVREATEGEVWKNDRYQVVKRLVPCGDGWPHMWHLSIKRLDKGIIRDWRELQHIKNLLVGPENEAIELFPAESRRVDAANQYHLYVLTDAAVRFPFGWKVRCVDGQDFVAGSRQRPFK